jgi:hypothetical protein
MNKHKSEHSDIAHRPQNEYDPNSYENYARNPYYNYDHALNHPSNSYFSNLFPPNAGQYDYYSFNNNDYVGPIPRRQAVHQANQKSQYISNPPLTETIFNYEGGVLYDILTDTKNDILLGQPPVTDMQWTSSALLTNPIQPAAPELINL